MLKSIFTSISRIFGNLFTINVIRRYKWHIMVITLVILNTCCAIVFYPSLNKLFLPSFGQTHLEFFDSGLEFGKLGTEERFNLCVSGPIYGDGIKTLNLGKNLAPKGSSSNIKCSSFLMPSSNDTVQQRSYQNGEDDEVYFSYCLYFVTLLSCVFWFFIVPLFLTQRLRITYKQGNGHLQMLRFRQTWQMLQPPDPAC